MLRELTDAVAGCFRRTAIEGGAPDDVVDADGREAAAGPAPAEDNPLAPGRLAGMLGRDDDGETEAPVPKRTRRRDDDAPVGAAQDLAPADPIDRAALAEAVQNLVRDHATATPKELGVLVEGIVACAGTSCEADVLRSAAAAGRRKSAANVAPPTLAARARAAMAFFEGAARGSGGLGADLTPAVRPEDAWIFNRPQGGHDYTAPAVPLTPPEQGGPVPLTQSSSASTPRLEPAQATQEGPGSIPTVDPGAASSTPDNPGLASALDGLDAVDQDQKALFEAMLCQGFAQLMIDAVHSHRGAAIKHGIEIDLVERMKPLAAQMAYDVATTSDLSEALYDTIARSLLCVELKPDAPATTPSTRHSAKPSLRPAREGPRVSHGDHSLTQVLQRKATEPRRQGRPQIISRAEEVQSGRRRAPRQGLFPLRRARRGPARRVGHVRPEAPAPAHARDAVDAINYL